MVAGALPAYWATLELGMLWRTSTKSKLVRLLVGSSTKVTAGLTSELRSWFTAMMKIEALVVLSALRLPLFPRRPFLLGACLTGLSGLGLARMDYFPLGIGETELLSGVVVGPVLGFLTGIVALLFRSDLEFARAYGLD